jgi:50S ribosomal protein L16 3-hydroxylase
MVTEKLSDRNAFAKWFGEYSSAPKYPEVDWTPEEPAEADDVRLWIGNGEPLTRNPASRFSFVRQEGGAVLLFVDGSSFESTGDAAAFAELLCAQDSIVVDISVTQSEPAMALLVQLYNQGSIAFDQED